MLLTTEAGAPTRFNPTALPPGIALAFVGLESVPKLAVKADRFKVNLDGRLAPASKLTGRLTELSLGALY